MKNLYKKYAIPHTLYPILLTFILSFFHSFIPTTLASFTDLPSNHPNKAAIEYLLSKGIIEGYSDDTIKPDQAINRAEALKVITEAVTLNEGTLPDGTNETENIEDLTDINVSDWFYKYVQIAIESGIVKGYEDKTFKAQNTINLAEALKIIFISFAVNVPGSETEINWYDKYIMAADTRKLIETQLDGEMHPEISLSRGALFEIVYRLMYLRENSLGAFEISLNWPSLEMAKYNFQMKYSPKYQLIEKEGEVTLWHRDELNKQTNYRLRSPLSSYLRVVLNKNEYGLSSDNFFKSIEAYCNNNCTRITNNKIPSLIKTNESSSKYFDQEQYLYLPNKKILMIYIEFSNEELKDEFKYDINAMLASLKYVENTIDSSNIDEILSTANANINVDGKGQETLDLFYDLIIIETDPIGVGAGPVDYYYSYQANVTLKYLRQYDTILDIENGRTSDF